MAEGTLVVGTIVSDFVESPACRLEGELGGSATYFALAARLFGPVTVVAPVGRDREPEVREVLAFADLDALTVVDEPTYSWHARRRTAGGDAETLERFAGSAEGYRPRVEGAAGWPRVVLLGSCDPAAQLAVATAAPAGALVAADTMDIFITEQREQVERAVGAAGVLLATEAELALLVGAGGPGAALARFGLDCVVLKKGALGAELWTGAGVSRLPAFPVVVVDPTGAGDALAGGFLGRLARAAPGGTPGTADLVEALCWGIVCASFAVEQPGIRGLVALTRQALEARIARYLPNIEQEVP